MQTLFRDGCYLLDKVSSVEDCSLYQTEMGVNARGLQKSERDKERDTQTLQDKETDDF